MKIENFIKQVQENGNFKTKKEAKEAIEVVLDTIKKNLLDGENISFTGLGSFKNVVVKGRKGKIPKSNIEYKSNDRKGVKFLLSKKFKDTLNS